MQHVSLGPSGIGENIEDDFPVQGVRIIRGGGAHFQGPEITSGHADFPEATDQGFDFRIACPRRHMHGHNRVLLCAYAKGGNGAIGSGQEHAARNQRDASDEDAQSYFDNGIERRSGRFEFRIHSNSLFWVL